MPCIMELQSHQFHSARPAPIIASRHLPGDETMTPDILIDDREALIEHCIPFLEEVKDMTSGTAAEGWLNRRHGPGSAFYQAVAGLVRKGVADGWAANIEIDGPRYRRSRI